MARSPSASPRWGGGVRDGGVVVVMAEARGHGVVVILSVLLLKSLLS